MRRAAPLQKIAHQLQRSLGRLHTKPLPDSRPGLASAREARRSDDRRERVAHHPTTSPHHPVPGSRRILLRAHSWCDPLANAERLLGRGARRLTSSGAPPLFCCSSAVGGLTPRAKLRGQDTRVTRRPPTPRQLQRSLDGKQQPGADNVGQVDRRRDLSRHSPSSISSS